jgi:hypothetical protein
MSISVTLLVAQTRACPAQHAGYLHSQSRTALFEIAIVRFLPLHRQSRQVVIVLRPTLMNGDDCDDSLGEGAPIVAARLDANHPPLPPPAGAPPRTNESPAPKIAASRATPAQASLSAPSGASRVPLASLSESG